MKFASVLTEEFLRRVEMHKNVLNFNKVVLQGIFKTPPQAFEIPFQEDEVIPGYTAILAVQSPLRTKKVRQQDTIYTSNIPIYAYRDVALAAKDMALENPFVYVSGDMREIITPARHLNRHGREKVAELLEVEFDDPLIDELMEVFRVFPSNEKRFDEMVALLSLEKFRKDDYPEGTMLKNSLVAFASSITPATEEKYINSADIQGLLFQAPHFLPLDNGKYKVVFKVMVNRVEGERHDVVHCLWFTDDWRTVKNKMRVGYPIRVQGSLESSIYRRRREATSAEIEAAASLLKVNPEHEVLWGQADEVGGLLDIFGIHPKANPFRPGIKPAVVHEVWVKNAYFNEEDLLY